MTIDEAIKHYEELAEVNEDIANNCDMDNWMNKADCEERASDYRQLAEWLTELKEAKRLLRLAVEDLNEIISTRHDNAQWRYANEAEKLLKDE